MDINSPELPASGTGGGGAPANDFPVTINTASNKRQRDNFDFCILFFSFVFLFDYFCEVQPMSFVAAQLIEAGGALVDVGGDGSGGGGALANDLSANTNPAITKTEQAPINFFIALLFVSYEGNTPLTLFCYPISL